MPASEPFFTQDGDSFIPTRQARGPWDPNSLHGRVISGLLGREIERQHCDEEFHCARLTTELFRMPPLAPLQVSIQPIRLGNRIRVIDGSVTSHGVEIARGRAVLLKKAPQPEGTVWSPPNWDVPPPGDIPAPQAPAGRENWVPMWETRPIRGAPFFGGGAEQKRAWLRETRQLVAGEDLSPFLRVALAADFTNPFANSGDHGLNFVNADITLYLHRLPVDEWVGFEVVSHQSDEGIAVAECALYDVSGAIGRSLVCAVANQHRR